MPGAELAPTFQPGGWIFLRLDRQNAESPAAETQAPKTQCRATAPNGSWPRSHAGSLTLFGKCQKAMHGRQNGGGIDKARPVRLDFMAGRMDEKEKEDRGSQGAGQKPARIPPLPAAKERKKASPHAKGEDDGRRKARLRANQLGNARERIARACPPCRVEPAWQTRPNRVRSSSRTPARQWPPR